MFTKEFVSKLKRTNVSVDGEKTRDRVEALWKPASKTVKDKIEELAGIARTTIYRCYRTGSISVKLIVPMAQLLNVNPFYLTGEVDENTPCTDEVIEDFLNQKGYAKKLKEWKNNSQNKSAKRTKKSELAGDDEAAEVELEVVENEMDTSMDDLSDSEIAARKLEKSTELAAKGSPMPIKSLTPKLQAYVDTLTEEDLVVLLRALMIRAKADEDDAQLATMLKLVLLS